MTVYPSQRGQARLYSTTTSVKRTAYLSATAAAAGNGRSARSSRNYTAHTMTAVVDSQQDCTTATVPSPPASSPGSLSSSTTNSANSQERVPPASPPPFCQVPPSSSTKPTLVSFQSSTNPQPFFPVATTPRASESPTSYQFPVVVPSPAATVIPASSIRTPSPPTVAQRQQQQQQQQAISGASRSTPRPARPRRHSTLDYTPTSAGRTAAMNGGNTPGAAAADGSNQLEAKVVICQSKERQERQRRKLMTPGALNCAYSGKSRRRQNFNRAPLHVWPFQLFPLVDDWGEFLDQKIDR